MKVAARVIGGISRGLQSSLARYEEQLTHAHRGLLGPLVLAILKATSCHVSKAARELARLGGTIAAREDRLFNFVHSPKLRLDSCKQAHIDRLKPDFKHAESIRVYADLSDTWKPYARKMGALDIVQDCSDPKKKWRPGSWTEGVRSS